MIDRGITPIAAAREACGYTMPVEPLHLSAVEGKTQPIPESQIVVPETLTPEVIE